MSCSCWHLNNVSTLFPGFVSRLSTAGARRPLFSIARSASVFGTRLLPFAAVFFDMCIQSLASLQERITRIFRPLIGVLKLFGLRVLQVPRAFGINSSVRL